MNEEKYISFVIKNLKGELSRDDFILLNSVTAQNKDWVKLRMDLEAAWDDSAEDPIIHDNIRKNEFKKRIQKSIQKDRRPIVWLKPLSIAAAMIGILVISYFSFLSKSNVYHGGDQGLYVALNDGSEVWLRENAKLSVHQFDQGNRILNLEGEAYFHVFKNEEAPFIVQSNEVTVKVLGTQFLLKNTPVRNYVALDEGSIEVSTITGKKELLVPGEQVVVEKDILTISKKTTHLSAWKTGKIILNKKPMINLVQDLEIIFNCKISIEGHMNSCTVNGVLIGKKIEDYLQQLSRQFHMQLSNDNNSHTLSGGSCD